MDKVANKFLHIFIRLVRKEMDDYEENEKQRCELYHRITNDAKYNNTDSSNCVSKVRG